MQKLLSDNRKAFLLFLVIALLFFGNSIGNSYSFDDSYVTVSNLKQPGKKFVPNNQYVSMGFAGIPKIWRSRYGHGNGTAYDYRPIVTTVFAIEYALIGQSPRTSHLINVILYAVVLFVLFLVLKEILAAYPFRESFAFVCCLLFAAHPLHTEVVDSLKSRDELLALLFSLLCMRHVLKFIETRKKIRLLWSGMFFFLAIYSKLTVAVFMGIIPVTLWMFTNATRRKLLFVAGAALVLFVLQAQIRKFLVTEKEVRILYHFENPMATEHFTFLTRVLFALKSLGIYIKLLIFPWPLRYYYGSAMITSDISVDDMDVWIAILFSIAALTFCYRTKNKLAFYGLLFFFMSIAPVLNFVRPVAGIVGERLTFIPSVGFLFFLTAVAYHFIKDPPAHFTPSFLVKKPVMYLSVALPVFLIYDWNRNTDWKDEITLFAHDAPYLKESAAANNLIANKYAEFLYTGNPNYQQQFLVEKCWEHYNLAIQADSSTYTAINNAGSIAFRYKNDPELALNYFLRTVRIQPVYPQVFENIGDCYLQLGKRNEAIAAYKISILENEKQFRPYVQIAALYIERGWYGEGLRVLTKAERQFSQSYPIIEKKGRCLYLLGEKQKGLQVLEEAFGIYPNKELAQQLAKYFSLENQVEKSNFYKEYFEK